MRTNREYLIEQAVMGEISPPAVAGGREWRIGPEGGAAVLPGVGGITYNCKVGQSAVAPRADHAEPGVSVKAKEADVNNALNIMACIGNEARVISGDGKGDCGVVTGKHGGVEHVLVDFPQKTLEKLAIGDRIQIRACGLGLELADFPSVSVMNITPELLEAATAPGPDGAIEVAVAFSIPAEVMGSGIGRSHVFSGDYDIQLSDESLVKETGLERLRLGDIIAVRDQLHTFGRSYRKGALSIGVVVHTLCTQSGHGPGITTIMSCADGRIVPVRDPGANIADILGIGSARKEADGEKDG